MLEEEIMFTKEMSGASEPFEKNDWVNLIYKLPIDSLQYSYKQG